MKNQIKTILLLGALSAILIAVGGALGPGYLYMFTAIALLMNLGAYFFSDRIVLAMHGAREVAPQQAPGLHRMVEELAWRAQIPKPRIFQIPEAQPNAFATGRSPKRGVVAVTAGILGLLSERELRGVLAHEIAHIKNRDILVASGAAGIAGAISHLAHVLSFATILGGHDQQDEERGPASGGLLFMLVAPIAAMLIQLGISRSREYLADETGARLCGVPEALASALEKLERRARVIPAEIEPAMAGLFIVNPLAGTGGLVNLFSTHPPMKERIRRLRAMAGKVWLVSA